MSRILRRTLSTFSESIPGPSTLPAATTSTLPQAVRRRRTLNAFQNAPSPITDPTPYLGKTPKQLPPKMEAEFQRLRGLDQFKGDEMSARRAFLKSQLAWRSRVRGSDESKFGFLARHEKMYLGVKGDRDGTELGLAGESIEGYSGAEGDTYGSVSVTEDSESSTMAQPQIIGQKIYLPNIQIRLVRNYTPPGEAYDPMVATFRIPQSMTKTDLRSYLSAVYSLPVTFIRTANYLGALGRTRGGQVRRKAGTTHNYKKAVVGLTEAFHYPDDVEEMKAMPDGVRLAKAREDWLEDNYRINNSEEYKKRVLMKYYKGYRWRSSTHDNEGNTVRAIMRKRKEREEKVAVEVARQRENGLRLEA